MKVLINVPSLSLLGGVSNHFLGLENYWSCKFKYNTIGSRFRLNGIMKMIIQVTESVQGLSSHQVNSKYFSFKVCLLMMNFVLRKRIMWFLHFLLLTITHPTLSDEAPEDNSMNVGRNVTIKPFLLCLRFHLVPLTAISGYQRHYRTG